MTAAVVRLEEPMIVAEQLAEVSTARAKADTRLVREAIDRVRQSLEQYERSAVERAQRRLTAVMLQAIGHSGELTSTVVAEHDSDEARAVLDAIAELTPMLSPPISLVPAPRGDADAPASAPSVESPPPPPSAPAPVSRPERQATMAEIEHVTKLIAEVGALEIGWEEQPTERLAHQLKAVAAEMRLRLTTFPHRHEMRWSLEKLPSRLHCVCRDSNVPDFINGVGSNTTGDWETIARKHRRAVYLFDQNASRPKAPKSIAKLGDVLGPKLSVVMTDAPPPSSDSDASRWLHLREVLRGRKLMLIGGNARPERVRTIEARTGIVVEWETIDKNAPRQVESIVRRIEGGSVAACLIAEGSMSHKDYRRVEKACRATRSRSAILFAFCHRAGGAQIDDALDTLEKRIADK
jgi:hypothetical protein